MFLSFSLALALALLLRGVARADHGGALDFDPGVLGQATHVDCAARRAVLREEGHIHIVHGPPLRKIGQEYRALHYIVHVRAVGLQQRLDALERGFRFGRDPTLATRAELAGQVESVPDPYCTGQEPAVANELDLALLRRGGAASGIAGCRNHDSAGAEHREAQITKQSHGVSPGLTFPMIRYHSFG